MSSYPDKPVEIQDELESFFHVILYNGLRYLQHNCTNVSRYMHEFFDQFDYVDGEYRSSIRKYFAMTSGRIDVSGRHPLVFKSHLTQTHPLNDLLDRLLSWFYARYEVARADDTFAFSALPIAEDHPSDDEVDDDSDPEGPLEEDDVVLGPVATDTFGPPEPKDMEKVKAAAANLQNHKVMAEFLRACHHNLQWPARDKVRDQLQPKYNYNKEEAFSMASLLKRTADDSFGTTASSSKRPRTLDQPRGDDVDEGAAIRDQGEKRAISASSLVVNDDPFLDDGIDR